jgi:hypothetical protein
MRGGYREGAGRKQGMAAKNAEEARHILSEMIMKEIVPIGEILIKKAKAGNIQAVRELFDRAFGKSTQSLKFELHEKNFPSPILSGVIPEKSKEESPKKDNSPLSDY